MKLRLFWLSKIPGSLQSIVAFAVLLSAHFCMADVIARSSETRVTFIELFSSESCSSCPPADQWFSKLTEQPGLWKTFVPAVFHVDYWNHLSWKDDFSNKIMTERQRSHAQTWRQPRVYTPGVIVNGNEWTGWRQSSTPPASKDEKVGELIIEKLGTKYNVSFSPKKKLTGGHTFHLALLGMGIKSKITSGENSGQLLIHDFTVLNWRQTVPKKSIGDKYVAEFDEPTTEKKVVSLALIAWVEKDGTPTPIQAVGGVVKTK